MKSAGCLETKLFGAETRSFLNEQAVITPIWAGNSGPGDQLADHSNCSFGIVAERQLNKARRAALLSVEPPHQAARGALRGRSLIGPCHIQASMNRKDLSFNNFLLLLKKKWLKAYFWTDKLMLFSVHQLVVSVETSWRSQWSFCRRRWRQRENKPTSVRMKLALLHICLNLKKLCLTLFCPCLSLFWTLFCCFKWWSIRLTPVRFDKTLRL